MKQLTITKAALTAGEPEDLTISFTGIPPHHGDLSVQANFYKDEAGLLARALIRTLPGGTLDQLLLELLQYRASLLAVPFPLPETNSKEEPCQSKTNP